MTDTPDTDVPVDRRVSAYEVIVNDYIATVRRDPVDGRWLVDSVVVGVAQQALFSAHATPGQTDPGNDPAQWRWDDPVVAQDAAETMLRALDGAVNLVVTVRPVPPEPPAA